MLGGSSGINYMLYVRGNKEDYDKWESMGNKGWSYKDVLPYFMKAEQQMGRYDHDSKYHGKDGYLPVSDVPFSSPLVEMYEELANNSGIPSNTDFNAENQFTFDVPQVILNTTLIRNSQTI